MTEGSIWLWWYLMLVGIPLLMAAFFISDRIKALAVQTIRVHK